MSKVAAKKVRVLVYSPAIIGYGNVLPEPVAPYVASEEQKKLLQESIVYRLQDDFDEDPAREAKCYRVDDYWIPEWLSVEEFVENYNSWGKFCEGLNVRDENGEGLRYFWVDALGENVRKLGLVSEEVRSIIYDLLSKNLRSAFKKSCKQQVLDWFEGKSSFRSPLSPNQIAALNRKYY